MKRSSSITTRSATRGFTVSQPLIIILITVIIVIVCGIVIYVSLHKAATNDSLTSTSSSSEQTQSQINAEQAAQNKRMCAAMSPEQRAQLAKMHVPSPCSME